MDEKNFLLFRSRHSILAPPEVVAPPDFAINKDHVPKLMYLTAVMKPSTDPGTGIFNDGKLAMIPFADLVPAKRTSRNRPAGTPELKPYSCTSESFYNIMTRPEGVMSKIRGKLPHLRGREITVVLQIDNAPPHVGKRNIERLNEFGASEDVRIRVVTQPPQSPDFNVLDLVLFHSLNAGTIAYRQGAHNFSQLNDNLQQVFADYPHDKHERAYAKLLDIYRGTLIALGGNTYTLPQTHVRFRQSNHIEALDYAVDATTVNRARAAYYVMRGQHAFVPHLPILNEDN